MYLPLLLILLCSYLALAFPAAAFPSLPGHTAHKGKGAHPVKAAVPQRQQKEVLFLSFSDPDSPDVGALIDEVEIQILGSSFMPVHFTIEYIDPWSTNSDEGGGNIRLGLLQKRHEEKAFDLVIAVEEQSLAFAEFDQTKRFPGAAFLFCVVEPANPAGWQAPKPGRTGVIRKLNYLPTLELALSQNPGTHSVIVVAGSSDFEKVELAEAKAEFNTYESTVNLQYWTDLTFLELQSRLASAEAGSVVLFLDFTVDADGQRLIPSRILPNISRAANRPIYGTMATSVGNGVVGGSVADLREVARALGQAATRISNGEKPENIPVQTGQFQHYLFDWRQLRRWAIPEDRLPPESVLIYRESSPWQVYRWRILALCAAIAIETLLILLLLHLRSRRKRAEYALHTKEAELLESQRLARLGSWHWDPKTDSISLLGEIWSRIGCEPGQSVPFQQLERFFPSWSWKRLTEAMKKIEQTGEADELELEAQQTDGTRVWLAVRGEVARDPNGRLIELRGTIQDLTERKQAEEATLKHAAILESSDDAIISKDLDGTITSWNAGAERIFGYTEAEAAGRPDTFITPPELLEEAAMILQRIQAGERIEHFETIRVTKEGKRVNVSLTVSPLKDWTGRIIGASKIARDVTEQKRAEERLKKSEEKFSKAFRQSPMALTLTTADGQRYLEVNETWERLSGLRREDILGKTVPEAGPWLHPAERRRLAQKLVEEGRIRDVEFQFRNKDGVLRIAEASAELVEVGGELCILAAAIDITARKRAERELLESEQRFRLMADSAPVLMWLSGPDNLCTDFNKEWLRFTGRSMQEEVGYGWTHSIHPEDAREFLGFYIRASTNRQDFALEYRFRRYDGEYRWMLNRGVPRLLEDGTFSGYIGCCVDITDQKEAKAAQAELSGRLIQAQEEERARISRELHDDISQRLALLANGLLELEQADGKRSNGSEEGELLQLWQLVTEISADVQHLSHELHPSKLRYLGLAAAAADLCRVFAKQHKVQVDCTIRALPKNMEENVSLSLFRALQESLHNIAKHSQAHHVKVELAGEFDKIRLRVSDDGIGFDAQSSKRGLGLISMQERLRSVGGRVVIWSQPSLGTQIEATVSSSGRDTASSLAS